MGILFSEIYTKAFGLFDDPKITAAFQTNKVQFYKIMYTYLQNAIAQFSTPSEIAYKLSNYKEPKGTMDKFVSDGVKTSYDLDEDFEIMENSAYIYTEGELQTSGKIENRVITFNDLLPVGQEYSVEQYYIGEIICDFSGIIVDEGGDSFVKQKVTNILARLLVESWAENQRNFLLDIKNTMSDTDFKLTSNSPILKSKIVWVAQLNDEIREDKNSLDWKIRANKMIHNNY